MLVPSSGDYVDAVTSDARSKLTPMTCTAVLAGPSRIRHVILVFLPLIVVRIPSYVLGGRRARGSVSQTPSLITAPIISYRCRFMVATAIARGAMLRTAANTSTTVSTAGSAGAPGGARAAMSCPVPAVNRYGRRTASHLLVGAMPATLAGVQIAHALLTRPQGARRSVCLPDSGRSAAYGWARRRCTSDPVLPFRLICARHTRVI